MHTVPQTVSCRSKCIGAVSATIVAGCPTVHWRSAWIAAGCQTIVFRSKIILSGRQTVHFGQSGSSLAARESSFARRRWSPAVRRFTGSPSGSSLAGRRFTVARLLDQPLEDRPRHQVA